MKTTIGCFVWFIIFAFFIICAVKIVSSGGFADSKDFVINGKTVTVKPYGLGNENTQKNDSINYELCTGNVVLSILFAETIIVPVYLVLDYLYVPVSKKNVVVATWTPTDKPDTTHRIIIKSTMTH